MSFTQPRWPTIRTLRTAVSAVKASQLAVAEPGSGYLASPHGWPYLAAHAAAVLLVIPRAGVARKTQKNVGLWLRNDWQAMPEPAKACIITVWIVGEPAHLWEWGCGFRVWCSIVPPHVCSSKCSGLVWDACPER
jgi:hypothetical protein